ncbi:MAG TPA: hypothetical protein VGR35_23225 [Tepidisphaeraceae bacterium]|nr:hypothetical protein [Tepidisphaeraceae bacterium]
MQSLLHQLENDAILLLYMDDELSAVDRAEVEQMLGSDAGLRADLERLRGLRDETAAILAAADASARLPVSENVAVRRATRMIWQWQLEKAHAAPVEQPLRELRFPWWSYPLTTAAALLIAFLVWWGHRSESPPRNLGRNYEYVPAGAQDLEGMRAEVEADLLAESFALSEDELLQMAQNQRIEEAVRALAALDDFDAMSTNSTERNW